MPWTTLGPSPDLTEPLLPQAFDLPPIVILVTEHGSLLHSDSNDLCLPVMWICLLLEVNSLLLYYLVFTSRLPVFRSLKSHMNQWFLTGADFAPPAQRTFGNAWGHCWLLKLGGRVPHNWGETRGVSDVGGGGAASHVRLMVHYSSVCTLSSFFHQSCGLLKFNIKNF